ncbi:MAG: hypothetical protein KC400_04290, partial [Methanolinea sp.]|nr:hypothetical protein [Methanolinea sp.]
GPSIDPYLVISAPAGYGTPLHRYIAGKNMAGRKITGQIGDEKATDRSPPFDQALIDRDHSLLRAKILAKLDDEDVRTALTRLGR